MFVLPTFALGVVASPTFTSVFNNSLTFPTIQVFNTEAEFIDETDATNYTLVHAKDTHKIYVWENTRWWIYNRDSVA